MFCQNCGQQLADNAVMCPHCGASTNRFPNLAMQTNVYQPASPSKSRVGYILLGLFLGALGVHNFYAGYTGRGLAQLLITIFAGWLVLPLVGVFIWVIVEICTISVDAQGKPLT